MRTPTRALLWGAALAVVVMLLSSCAAGAPGYPDPAPVSGDVRAHDPSMVKTANGTYYLYSTHDLVQMRTSTDRRRFTRTGSALAAPLNWSAEYGTTSDLWAPDVSYHRGTYWLYYAVSQFGSNESAIGLATSPTGAPGSFTDHGKVYASTSGGDANAIDPNLLVDATGRWWLTFGSFWSGIKMIQLDPTTGKQLASDTRVYALAQRPAPDAEEGAYVLAAHGYYYLFVSWGSCCQGTSSTYRIMVGRSRTVTGPYRDASGRLLSRGGGTPVLATHGRIVGPGGESVLRDNGVDYLVYHWYDTDTVPGNCGCRLGMNRLRFPGGWPSVLPR